MEVKFLFFIEREFHISLLKNVIDYIHNHKLGKIALGSFAYQESDESFAGWGLRPETLNKYFNYPLDMVNDPYAYKPDITFMADFSYQYVEGLGKIVNIGHGTISKGWFFSEKNISKRENCADLICVPGTIHRQILSKQVFIPIEVTGMPKLDSLFSNPPDKQAILRKMNLPLQNKTLLFAPTFNNEFSIVPYMEANLRKYIPDYINIIIKLHGAAPEEWKNNYRRLAQTVSNIYYTEDLDITESIIASDLLLTDVSSVIYEYLPLNKPILLFDSPHQTEYQMYDPKDLEYKFRDVGDRFSSLDKIQELLFKNILNPVREDRIKEIGKQFISVTDGTSSAKVVQRALDLLKLDKPKDVIFVRSENQQDIHKYQNLWSSRYEIIYLTNQILPENFTCKTPEPLSKVLSSLDYPPERKIMYFEADWTTSPMLPTFLFAHLNYNEKIGLICPLLDDQQNITLQNLNMRVKDAHNSERPMLGLQLTYSLPGQASEIDFALPGCFAIKQKDIPLQSRTSVIIDEKIYWLDLLKNILQNNKAFYLAYDCLLYNQYTKAQKKSETSTPKTKVEAKPKNRLSIDELQRAIEADPFNKDNIIQIIKLYFQEKNYDLVEVFCNMLETDPEAILYAARAMEKQNFNHEALLKLGKVNLHFVKDPLLRAEILTEMAKLNVKESNIPQGMVLLKQALELDPDNVTAHLVLGSAYLMQSNFDAAQKEYQFCFQRDATNYNALLGIALVWQNKENYEEAIRIYMTLLEDNEEDLSIIKNLLTCSYLSKNFAPVEHALREYLSLHPANLNVLFTFAGVLYEQKKYAETLDALDKILLFDDNYPGANELKNKINMVY